MDNFKGNSDKHFLWEFESDGSVQYWGFSVIFEFFVCECSLKVAKCESYNNHLMDVYGSVDSSYYCGNLNCNIPIEKCSSPLTLIEFFTMENVSKNDEFQIISNNRTTFEIVDWNYDTHVAYLNSSSENVFQVITHSSSNINTLYFHVEEFYVPPELKIHLSENQSSVIIDTAINNLTTFEISSEIKNRFFIIYCPNPNLIGLYTDTSLKTPIKYWTKMPLTGRKTVACNKCILERDKFVAYSSSYTETTYLAVRLPLRAGNCVFEETIFNTNQRTSLTITSLSNKNGSCLISILVDGLYRIKHLWTTSRTQNVKMFVGIDQKKLFLEFNSNTSEIWENTALWSTVYTILMPDSTAIFSWILIWHYMTSFFLKQLMNEFTSTKQENIALSSTAIISVGNVGEKVSKTNDDEKREVEILEAEQACVEAKNDENGVLIAGDIKYDHVRRGTEETFKKFKEFLRDLEKSRQDQINSMPLDDLNAAEKELSDNLFELINAHDCVQEESKACFESVIEIQEKTLKIDEGKAAAIWFMQDAKEKNPVPLAEEASAVLKKALLHPIDTLKNFKNKTSMALAAIFLGGILAAVHLFTLPIILPLATLSDVVFGTIAISSTAVISVGNVGENVSKINDDEKHEVEILEAEQACVETKNDENGVLIAGDIKYDHVRRGTEETIKKLTEFLRDLEKSRQDQINSVSFDDLNAAEAEEDSDSEI
uniref:Uncharacterized protein n=1 Tax=Panagrolaimus sp. PS1159 TaxID=55785 RepID=A0AC35F3K1_9BILA